MEMLATPIFNFLNEVWGKSEMELVRASALPTVDETEPSIITNTMFQFVTGQAGTGKTTAIKREIQNSKGKRRAVLAATTGIAAVNLASSTASGASDVTTINSLLGYFDTNGLKDLYASRRLREKLHKIARQYQAIAIDEVSMMDSEACDILIDACEQVNNEYQDIADKYEDVGGFGLVFIGDFCQLPPINALYAFEGNRWRDTFGQNVHKLTKVWRQDNKEFLKALNAARCGDGDTCSQILAGNGKTKFIPITSHKFDGTTIFAVNSKVEAFNGNRLRELVGCGKKVYTFTSSRWGMQRSEWKLIPQELTITKDSYVMILSNDAPKFTYANGDCGYVEEVVGSDYAMVMLKRSGKLVKVPKVCRKVYQREDPDGMVKPEYASRKEYVEQYLKSVNANAGEMESVDDAYRTHLVQLTATARRMRLTTSSPYFDYVEGKWVMGEILYMPLRLAYASTVHKTQGLTLDQVQIEITHHFFGSPSMAYVALSRVRSPEGLTIAGTPWVLAERTNVLGEVLEWI